MQLKKIISVMIILFISPQATGAISLRSKHKISVNRDKKSDHDEIKPPELFKYYYPKNAHIRTLIDRWKAKDGNYIWELSGLFEGDILIHQNDVIRNGVKRRKYRWPNSTIPYYIDKKDFDSSEVEQIYNVIDEFNARTCLLFRRYRADDPNFIVIKGNYTGCWSKIGMRPGGQIVNLQTNSGCIKHGTIIHEILHSVGFVHQHSATDRDQFITVVWDNIKDGRHHNFDTRNYTIDFGVGYDYGSVMHYSKKAFSKNGKPTLVPLEAGAKLGQRKGFSPKDVEKVNNMYRKIYCHTDPVEPISSPSSGGFEINLFDLVLSWLDNLFSLFS